MDDLIAELKQQRIWFCWVWKQTQNGKPSKKPIASTGGPTGTSENWSHTWVTYEEAMAAVETIHAAGVGFVIPEGFFFLDADHYELNDPFIQLLLERFNSYTERSVSGGGIHIYGKCDLNQLPITTDKDGRKKIDSAYYVKNPGNNLELYIGGLTNRFAVYTGDVVWEEPLRECTAAVLTTLKCNMLRSTKPKRPALPR
jgi:primase-polymerase (primpol)-like protein